MEILSKYLSVAEANHHSDLAGPAEEKSAAEVKPQETSGSFGSPSDIELDWQLLIERLGGEELVDEIMPIFLKDNTERMKMLTDAMGKVDQKEIKFYAHSIKGATATIGAARISELAKQLELAARDGDSAKYKPLFDEINVRFARLVEFLSKSDWKDFHEQQRRAVLIQSFLSQEMKVEKPITYSELVRYYDSIKDENYKKDESIEFRLIDLEIEKFADPNDPNVNAGQKAMQLAAELAEKIKNGENFAELAKKYSNDEAAQNGGLWKPVRPGSLVEPYNAIETAVETMSIGQTSPPIAAKDHIFIVKLENKQAQEYEPFEKVQTEVEGRFVLERRRKMVDDMMNKIMAQVDLSYADNFLEFCVERAWLQAGK